MINKNILFGHHQYILYLDTGLFIYLTNCCVNYVHWCVCMTVWRSSFIWQWFIQIFDNQYFMFDNLYVHIFGNLLFIKYYEMHPPIHIFCSLLTNPLNKLLFTIITLILIHTLIYSACSSLLKSKKSCYVKSKTKVKIK